MSQESLRDSTVISRTVRLINDYKACVVYTGRLEEDIAAYQKVNNYLRMEREEFSNLLQDCETVIDDCKKDLVGTIRSLDKSERRRKRGRFVYTAIGAGSAIVVMILIKQ